MGLNIGGAPSQGAGGTTPNTTPAQAQAAAAAAAAASGSGSSTANSVLLGTLLAQISENTDSSSVNTNSSDVDDTNATGSDLANTQKVEGDTGSESDTGSDSGSGNSADTGSTTEKATASNQVDSTTSITQALSGNRVANTSSISNLTSAIEGKDGLPSGQLVSPSTSKAASGFALNTEKFAADVTSFGADFSAHAGSLGIPSGVVAQASAHFQNAGNLAARLNTLSDAGGSDVAATKLINGVQAELTKGFQAVTPTLISNPSTMENALLLDPEMPAGIAGLMASALSTFATTSQLTPASAVPSASGASTSSTVSGNAPSSDTSASSTAASTSSGSSGASFSGESIYALSQAIGAFSANAAMGVILQNNYQSLQSSYNAQISADSDKQANASTQNTINEVKENEKKESESSKKHGFLSIFTEALSCIGAALVVATGVFIACVTAETGVGVAGGAMIAAIGVGMMAQSISTAAGGPSSFTQVIAQDLAKATGTNAQDWSIALEAVATVAATVAGGMTGNPIMALMMFSTLMTQSGLMTTTAEAAGASSDEAMYVNLAVGLLPLVMGGFMALSGSFSGLAESAESASTAAETTATATTDVSTTADAATSTNVSSTTEVSSSGTTPDATDAPSTAPNTSASTDASASADDSDAVSSDDETTSTTSDAPTDGTTTDPTTDPTTTTEAASSGSGTESVAEIFAKMTAEQETLGAEIQNNLTGALNNIASTTAEDIANTVQKAESATEKLTESAVSGTDDTAGSAQTAGGTKSYAVREGYLSDATSARIGQVATGIQISGGILSGLGTIGQSLISISLAKTQQEIAVIQGNLETNKAQLSSLYTILNTIEKFNANQLSASANITTGVNQGNATMSQDAAGDYSNIWNPV